MLFQLFLVKKARKISGIRDESWCEMFILLLSVTDILNVTKDRKIMMVRRDSCVRYLCVRVFFYFSFFSNSEFLHEGNRTGTFYLSALKAGKEEK